MKTRINFLDNLRTFLIFLVILLHAGMIYESGFDSFWIVSDPAKLNPIALVRMYLDIFIMFIMFFISGYFISNSLKGRNGWDFVTSKFKRILIPWIIAVFTLIPAYKAIFLYSRGLPQEEWYSYFHLFQRAGTDLSFFPNNPTLSWLWFLPVLFIFQILYLAMYKLNLLKLKISLRTGVVMTLVIGVGYAMIISVTGLTGWAHTPLLDFQRERLLVYFMAFLLGSLCNILNIFGSGTLNRKYYIISNVVLAASLAVFTIIAINLFYNIVDPSRNYFYFSSLIDRLLYYISLLFSMLSFLHIFIYTFQKSFNNTNNLFNHLNRNSYVVYIIHMIVLGVIAVLLMSISLPTVIKYLVLSVLTFAVSNIIVYAYRSIFTKPVTMKTITAIMIAATFLTVTVYIKQANPASKSEQSSVLPAIPDIGLHEAAITGNLEVIKQHISAGSDLNEKEPSGGSSPLITAITFGKTDVALLLIESGADVNYTNNEGSTPLHTAAFFCRTEIVKALLESGADRNIRNNAGSTSFESVIVPFEAVKGIYDYFGQAFGPLGMELDYEFIKSERSVIADLLCNK